MYGQFNQGNVTHHSWIGKNKNIKRLRCKNCRCNFSENRGTLRERAHLGEEKQERLLKCFRWGVCEEGCADICEVSLKSVQLFRKKAAQHGKQHHEAKVKEVNAPAVQMDELRAKQGGSVTWIGAAMAINSFLILAVTLGQRNQQLANDLFAEIWGRCKWIGIFLSDGWSCYYTAILLCFGRIHSPRNSEEKRRRKKAERLKLKKSDPFYGQVVKQTTLLHK
jgi:transposase-like protein